MFDLVFVREEAERQDEGWDALEGEIVLGDHRERFLAPLDPWVRADYERHWIAAARRLLAGADRSAFITAAFQFWWPVWRDSSGLVAREQLLWADSVASVFDPADPFRAVGDRVQAGPDGPAISEWHLSLDDIQGFVDRRSGAYAPD